MSNINYLNFQYPACKESAYEFTVQPTAGVLEPAGTSGTIFTITYKPTESGKGVPLPDVIGALLEKRCVF